MLWLIKKQGKCVKKLLRSQVSLEGLGNPNLQKISAHECLKWQSQSAGTSSLYRKIIYCSPRSVSKQLLESFACLVFARSIFCRWYKFAPNKFKVFAIVRNVLFGHRLGASIPALLCHIRSVADTIQADFQIRPA